MSIKSSIHSWILNHKGLTVYSSLPEKIISVKHGEDDYSWNDLVLDVYAKFPRDPDSESTDLKEAVLDSRYMFVPESKTFYSWHCGDLFIIASLVTTDQQDIEKELATLYQLRKAMKDRFLGVLFCDFDDIQGPVPVYNNSPLDEVMTYQLAAQGMSLAAMGQSELPKHVVGPIPVPGSKNYQTLVYNFTRPVTDSEDPRIIAGGRPGVLFMIFNLEKIEKDVLEFLEAFLIQWKATPDVTPDGLEDLSENVRLTITLAWDLIKYRDKQNEYLRELVTKYYSELILLRQENLKLCMELRKVIQKNVEC